MSTDIFTWKDKAKQHNTHMYRAFNQQNRMVNKRKKKSILGVSAFSLFNAAYQGIILFVGILLFSIFLDLLPKKETFTTSLL